MEQSEIYLFNKLKNEFSGRHAEIVFENKAIMQLYFLNEIVSKKENINYQLLNIEDGLYQLNYYQNDIVHIMIINLPQNLITMVSSVIDKNNSSASFIVQKGSFYFVENSDDTCNLITNQQKALDFWNRYFNLHDETAIDEYLDDFYIQHNPNVADGKEAFRNEFQPRFLTDMKECTTIVKKVVARDNLVFIHNILKRSPMVKGHAAVDIFRFENGKIVEHWDVIQPMPEVSKNNHPMF